jgi:hypothetical protein
MEMGVALKNVCELTAFDYRVIRFVEHRAARGWHRVGGGNNERIVTDNR